jgi:DNA invertase Pin-like site-specific DNA recombinase
MRAVIYARYSSDQQRDASIDDQVRLCRARIEREGWDHATTYTDRATSGASALRAGYQKLIEDARADRFDVVVAEALDRLSRDQEDIAGLYKRLSFAGVRILTLAEGEIADLHVGLKGTMNALFLKDLAQKTRRGLEGRVRQGRSGGGLCYGYEVVRETDALGNPVRGGRCINEREAEVIRRILREFAAGRSPRAIARGLNEESIPGPGGQLWRDTTIRGHRTRGTGFVNNELYIGRLVWNRQRYVKDPETGKRLARPNPPEDWIVEEVPDLRIVNDDLWNAVRRRQDEILATPAVQKIKESRFWTRRRARHLLTGLVYCGTCGARFTSVGRDYLSCGRARNSGNCGNRQSIRRPLLEQLILDALKSRLMEPDAVKEFVSEFGKEFNRLNREVEFEREAKAKELNDVSRQLNSLIDAIADGLRTAGLKARLEDLESRKERLEQELGDAPPPVPRLHPNLAEVYRSKVENLHEALAEPKAHDEALNLLRGLVERIDMNPVEGGFEIALTGDIARMMALSMSEGKTKKAAFDEKTACSVKVVAGARNHRELTLHTPV